MSDRIIVERQAPPVRPRLSLLEDCYVERGDKNDWELLHELHYKAEKLPFGAQFFRCVLAGEVIGVGIMSMPAAMNRGRNKLFPQMCPNQGGIDTRVVSRDRFIGWNKISRTNSRLVLDTMYRGAGIAYRMQNLMMRLSGWRVIEFQSSMSRFNPFAAKAGIRFVPPDKNPKFDKGLAWFRRWFECNPADYVGVMAELAAMSPPARAKCEHEMREFYYANSAREKTGNAVKDYIARHGTHRVTHMAIGEVLKNLQQLVLAAPLYGAYVNPDAGRALPARLPLLCFDYQPTDQPLRLELLDTP